MAIHVHPLVIQIRFYEEGMYVDKSLQEMYKQYRGVANVTIDDAGTARVSLLKCEDFSKTDFDDIKNYLRSVGARKMMYKHKDHEREVYL